MPRHKPIRFETSLEPKLVKEVRRIIRENQKAKTVLNATLALAAVGGILTLATIAPATLVGLGTLIKTGKQQKYQQYRELWTNFRKLKQRGAFEFAEEKDGYLVYRFTEKGKEKIKKLIFEEMNVTKPKRWDGKWRLVIFDIPESRKQARNALRDKLKEMNFYQCQRSVWIHPFPCGEEVAFITHLFNIEPYVKVFRVDEMNDGRVIYHFKNLIKEIVTK